MPREVEEEEKGPITNMLDKLRGYYNYSLDVVKDLKLDEKAKWVTQYHDHTTCFPSHHLITARVQQHNLLL